MSRYILGEAGRREMLKDLPENRALEVGLSPYFCYFKWSHQGLAGALVEAWRLYSVPSSVILFIIEDVTYNICDQRFHEFEIR